MSSDRRDLGFTLIEILIVISIITILMSIVISNLGPALDTGNKTVASQTVTHLSAALDRFHADMNYYPGGDAEPDENDFPALFEALMGDKPPRGKGGRSAPYLEKTKTDTAVWDEDLGEYRQPTFEERFDPEVEKYLIDPWGRPYWYRHNKGRERAGYMGRPSTADIWSLGSDGINHGVPGAEPDGGRTVDDIGNW